MEFFSSQVKCSVNQVKTGSGCHSASSVKEVQRKEKKVALLDASNHSLSQPGARVSFGHSNPQKSPPGPKFVPE